MDNYQTSKCMFLFFDPELKLTELESPEHLTSKSHNAIFSPSKEKAFSWDPQHTCKASVTHFLFNYINSFPILFLNRDITNNRIIRCDSWLRPHIIMTIENAISYTFKKMSGGRFRDMVAISIFHFFPTILINTIVMQ